MSAKAAAWCRGARAGKGQRQPLLRAPRDTESRRGHLNEGWTDSSPKVARVPPAREGGVSRPATVVPVGPVEVWTQALCGQN